MIDPKPEDSVSEQSQDELEPLPAGLEAPNRDYSDLIGSTVSYEFYKWDGGDIGEVLKHGRE